MKPNEVILQEDLDLETFRAPQSAKVSAKAGHAQTMGIASIVSLAANRFVFRENRGTPGRLLEQSVVVSVPPGTGFFTTVPHFTGEFSTPDFSRPTERPLGRFHVLIGMRGNNLVCQVQLTDANADDPIHIEVTGIVVFFN